MDNLSRTPRRRAFTLIELLTVIAVIGILASILIPTVGAAKKSANKAKTKAQFVGWANALQQFKSTYGYYPQIFSAEGEINLNSKSEDFIKALSGRTAKGNDLTTDEIASTGNRRAASFYSFSEGEFQSDGSGNISETQLADAFGNPNIIIRVDKDNDGKITDLPKEATGKAKAKVKVAIWSVEDSKEGYVGVYSWE